ncbi:hypothetical protein PG985_000111 [Apiospora marii]|uniref:uncharacterized protein n=1 Tax=Apiospora marii TaxID=335849 RepID=UPI00312DDC3A
MNYLGLRAINRTPFRQGSVPTGTAYEVQLPRHSCSMWPRTHPRAYTNSTDDYFARLSVKTVIVLLDSIPNLNRVALGIRDNATQIRICILTGHCDRCGYNSSRRRSIPTFCVHFESDTEQQGMTDHNCTSEIPWETWDMDCNLLAYRLTLDLQTSLKSLVLTPTYPVRALFERIRDLVVSIAASCTSHCIVCNKDLGCQVSRATSCYDPDCWDTFIFSWPLSVRLSPLLRDPSVLDLLLTLLMGDLETKVPPPGENPDDYALTVEDMKAAINSFPAMHAGITTAELIGSDPLWDNRRMVLEYMCYLFEGMLVPTPTDSEVTGMSVHQSFLLLNTNLDRQVEYEELHYQDSNQHGKNPCLVAST